DSGAQQRAVFAVIVEKVPAGEPTGDVRAARAGDRRHRVAEEPAGPPVAAAHRDDAEPDRGNAGTFVIGHPLVEEPAGLGRVARPFADPTAGISRGVLSADVQDPGVAV